MIPASELTAMRAVATSALDIAGILVQRVTLSDDGYGGQTESWATTATVAGGWAKPSAAVMTMYASKIGSLASWVVRLPYGTSCNAGDRLVMPTGETLLVQADLSQSSYSTSKRVLASEIRP